MKTKEITGLSDKEVKVKLSDEKLNLTKMTLGHAISPMENPLKIRSTRKLIARLHTEIRKRALSQSAK
jgi:large subunit ribosomal protein L29